MRNHIYTVKAYPDFTLDVRFAQQVQAIAEAIENNQTRSAEYLSEKMVLDYGTHVITSIEAGATLVQEDYLSSKFVSDTVTERSSITAQAGLNFFDKVKFDISSQSTKESSLLRAYQSNITYSITTSHGGGTPFYPGITLQKWQESTRNNLVAVDRFGFPLHYFITTNSLPDLPQPTVNKAALSVSQAIERYYKVNTRPGCVNVSSENFNFQANVDDSSCKGPATNLSFGGVYQECEQLTPDADPLCRALAQKNPDTGAFSCRSPYTPTLLRSVVRQQQYTSMDCYDQKYHCGIFGLRHCHRKICQDNYHVRSARVNTYWCSVNNGQTSQYSGYLFGGIYSSSIINPLTSAKSCPQNFIALKFLSDGQVICVSKDYEAGARFSVPFGGLFSCQSNNPLAKSERRCPPEFSQHLAAVSDGCEILYCVQSGLFTGGQLLPVHLPPFTNPPLINTQFTNTVVVMTDSDKNWIKIGATRIWKAATLEEIREMQHNLELDQGQMSTGQKVGTAFGVIGMMVVILVAIVLVRRRRRISGLSRGYQEIQNGVDEEEVREEARQ